MNVSPRSRDGSEGWLCFKAGDWMSSPGSPIFEKNDGFRTISRKANALFDAKTKNNHR
jgi:hypothetical protein